MKKNIKRIILCFIMLAAFLLLGTLTVSSAALETEPNTEAVSDEVLPDGVYSFFNYGSFFYMDVRPRMNNHSVILQQRSYQNIPASEVNRSALFRVEHISDTKYIIKPLYNTRHALSFANDSDHIVIRGINMTSISPILNGQ